MACLILLLPCVYCIGWRPPNHPPINILTHPLWRIARSCGVFGITQHGSKREKVLILWVLSGLLAIAAVSRTGSQSSTILCLYIVCICTYTYRVVRINSIPSSCYAMPCHRVTLYIDLPYNNIENPGIAWTITSVLNVHFPIAIQSVNPKRAHCIPENTRSPPYTSYKYRHHI